MLPVVNCVAPTAILFLNILFVCVFDDSIPKTLVIRITPHQHNVRRLNRHVCPGADRNAHIGLCQSRHLIDRFPRLHNPRLFCLERYQDMNNIVMELSALLSGYLRLVKRRHNGRSTITGFGITNECHEHIQRVELRGIAQRQVWPEGVAAVGVTGAAVGVE